MTDKILAIATCLLFCEVLRQKKLNPTQEKKLENLIVLLQTTKKVTSMLILSWGAILVFQILTKSSRWELSLVSLLGCLATIHIQIHNIKKASENLTKVLLKNTVAVISFIKPNSEDIQIWFKKTGEEWPRLKIEIGQNHFPTPLTEYPTRPVEKISQLFRTSQAFENKHFQKEFKKTLNEAGVSHPMDIEGNATIKELQTFLENTLIPSR